MSSPMPAPCWVIHDGAAGNRRQALALAQALELPVREWSLQANLVTRCCAPRAFPGARFGAEFDRALRAPVATLAIGCGRIAALATRQLRLAGVPTVQILDPRITTQHWDLLIAPEHDGLRGENVLSLLGSLNPVDGQWLQHAREENPQPGKLSSPRTAVLLGGPTPATGFDRSALEVLCAKLEYWLARDGGSVLLCASARTPRDWAGLLRDRYRDQANLVWVDASDGPNPYAAVLGWAERIVASPDSVNMVSEACATQVPVFVAEPDRATGRVGVFLRSLLVRGRIRAQERDCSMFASPAIIETPRIAALVRERLSLR